METWKGWNIKNKWINRIGNIFIEILSKVRRKKTPGLKSKL